MDLDRNNNLRANRDVPYLKFLRYRDMNAEIRATGAQPMRDYPVTAVFEIEDDITGGVTEREFSVNALFVGEDEPVRLPENSVYGSPRKTGWGRKKTTSSSRARRRSKTRKSRRGAGGGR